MLTHTPKEEKVTTGEIVWETILDLANDERSITRQVLRDVTNLSYEIIDDHIKKLENKGKVVKVGKGMIEVVVKYPPERVQSLTPLPSGKVKWEMGDILVEFTPTEVRRHSMMFAGFARQFEDLELSNKALIRTAELADRIRELERTIAALKQPKNEAQMDLLGSAV